ncbi:MULTISPECIES: helix-turn-helix domain-containing protein [Bacillus cereus group]|uniref:helix-turn-helix domain-containing protein n=1 Tax=Bacillus cereus group TaxID=86661 RepID=UPI0012386462|nr:helix-turn-helix domain-containing protein [Bacillus cereus]KAA6461527.1 MarR family transcriptional regulator [Bacillus cereus]KAA6472449.1 MarR family transcriptional regulator [Bacillus cereus]KAB2414281.1 MarR family transcriptional regulator [Bacillus cereus]KAB2436021.1 MarR family transcriptional regulator [Bacillus cereus]KAB2464043.1 MarR family transcriptional regulator [Bacillus cereus]
MLFMLDEIMTTREASDRWGITSDALRMKLKHSSKIPLLKDEGKIKYYKSKGNERGEWILTVEAMEVLFPRNYSKKEKEV